MSNVVKYLRYSLALNAPAIVTTLSGDPNGARTQPFVPGSAVRGAVAARLLAENGNPDGPPQPGERFRQFVLDGSVRYLHAYPEYRGDRALPTPNPWRVEKGLRTTQSFHAFDLGAFTGAINDETEFEIDSAGTLTIDPDDVWPAAAIQQAGLRPFHAFGGTEVHGVPVRTDARLHQQRDRNKGRSWTKKHNGREEPQGAIFAYEFLEAGQVFHGVIQVFADNDDSAHAKLDQLKTLLDGKMISIGRSRRAGYGGEALVRCHSVESHEARWGDVQGDVEAGSQFRAYLLSSCVSRDQKTGQVDPATLPDTIVEALGGANVVKADRTYWEFEVIGGFNRKWQSEVPQVLAVKAGSILVLQALQPIPPTRLRSAEHSGVGERRVEGFGRIIFLKHRKAQTVRIHNELPSGEPATQPAEKPQEVPFLQRRLLDAAFERSLDAKVQGVVRGAQRIPTTSLIGRLRIPLRQGNAEQGLHTLQALLQEASEANPGALKKEAQDKLANCRFSIGKSLKQWLKEAATKEFGTRQASNPKQSDCLGTDRSLAEHVAAEHGAFYAARFIDTVLATLARMKRRQGGEANNE